MNPLSWLENHTQQAVMSVKPLAGQTACSYLVVLENGNRYVLRSQTARATALGVDYRQEAAILEAISPLQFAPSVVYADHKGAILCWQEGQSPSHYDEALLQQLAAHFARLHKLPLQAVHSVANIATLDLATRCQFLWHQIPQAKRPLLAAVSFPAIQPFAQALCHHDVHLGNLIQCHHQLILIDWEYAAISDPALDIALFLSDPALSPAHKGYFLKNYLQRSQFNASRFAQKMLEYQPYIKQLYQLWTLI